MSITYEEAHRLARAQVEEFKDFLDTMSGWQRTGRDPGKHYTRWEAPNEYQIHLEAPCDDAHCSMECKVALSGHGSRGFVFFPRDEESGKYWNIDENGAHQISNDRDSWTRAWKAWVKSVDSMP